MKTISTTAWHGKSMAAYLFIKFEILDGDYSTCP
jgi:hypothetical protein